MVVEPPPPIVLPHPEPIRTVPVQFHVIETGAICLAPKQYENMSLNMAEILRWVQEAQARLNWYANRAQQPPE